MTYKEFLLKLANAIKDQTYLGHRCFYLCHIIEGDEYCQPVIQSFNSYSCFEFHSFNLMTYRRFLMESIENALAAQGWGNALRSEYLQSICESDCDGYNDLRALFLKKLASGVSE